MSLRAAGRLVFHFFVLFCFVLFFFSFPSLSVPSGTFCLVFRLRGYNIAFCPFFFTPINSVKGVLHPWALFMKTMSICLRNKVTLDKVPMDLVRNVQRNSKITVFF